MVTATTTTLRTPAILYWVTRAGGTDTNFNIFGWIRSRIESGTYRADGTTKHTRLFDRCQLFWLHVHPMQWSSVCNKCSSVIDFKWCELVWVSWGGLFLQIKDSNMQASESVLFKHIWIEVRLWDFQNIQISTCKQDNCDRGNCTVARRQYLFVWW